VKTHAGISTRSTSRLIVSNRQPWKIRIERVNPVHQFLRLGPEVRVVQQALAIPAVDGPADELGAYVLDQAHIIVAVAILTVAFRPPRHQEIRHGHGAVQVVLQHFP
jgi:hypothetical protein